MDTTSHNFTWQIFAFGEYNNSVLFDVAIINENNIWAVGEIYMNDSLGNPDPNSYNAVHWDGQSWELKRINMQSSCNPVTYPPLKAIWAFSSNNIVFTCGGSMGWFDGTTNRTDCSVSSLLTGTINKIWGTSSNDLYIVGNNGSLAHYGGQSIGWNKIESGTSLSFQDIWGELDSGSLELLAIASNKFSTGGKYLLKINGNNVIHLNDLISTAVSLSGVWFVPNKKYYLVGDGIYNKHFLSDNKWQPDSIIYQLKYYPYSVRGNNINDIIVSGEGGTISHYNGITWRIYNGENPYDRLLSTSIKNAITISVGTRYNNGINNQGIMYIGRR
jgi:hypothetical protein